MPSVLVAILGLGGPAHAARVTGVVRQGGSGAPVGQVTIVVGDQTTVSDAGGAFEIDGVPPGPVLVELRSPDWRPLHTVRPTVVEEPMTSVLLWVAPTRGHELVATYQVRPEPGIRRVMRLDDAVGLAGTFGDPLRLLSAQPGISRTPFDAGWLLVRGGDYDDPGLFLDGVRIPQVQHLGGFTSVLHPAMVESLQFWPGVFPSRYGAATSGVVDVVPARIGDVPRAIAGVNVVFASAFAETPLPFGGIAVAARRSYLDGVLGLVVGSEGAQIAPRFWDAQARVEIGPHAVSVLAFSDVATTPANTEEEVVDVRQQAAQVQARLVLGEPTTLWVWLTANRRSLVGITAPIDQWEVQPGLRVEHTRELPRQGQWTLGFEGQQRLIQVARGDARRDVLAWTADPYVGAQLGYPLTLWSEVRLESLVGLQQPSRTGWSPRGGVRWALSPSVELHAEVGHLHQPAPIALLYGTTEGVHLALEQSSQVAGGVRLRTPRWGLTVEGFHRVLGHLALTEVDGSLGQGAGTATGLEMWASYRTPELTLDAVYQYTTTTRAEDERYVEETSAPWYFDQPHRLELRGALAVPRDWTLGARFRATSGFPRTRSDGTVEPTSAYDILRQAEIPLDIPFDRDRLAPYHSLDLRVAHTSTFRRWRLLASLDVLNVYHRRVVEPVISGFGENQPAYGFGLPILPVFGVEAEWFPARPQAAALTCAPVSSSRRRACSARRGGRSSRISYPSLATARERTGNTTSSRP